MKTLGIYALDNMVLKCTPCAVVQMRTCNLRGKQVAGIEKGEGRINNNRVRIRSRDSAGCG
jgi:hypothetical protein